MKYLLSMGLLLFFLVGISQQRPFINTLSKTSGTVGETVTISGSGFSPGDMQVNFGAGIATIVNESSSQLEVLVPNTATYGPVVVTDLNTGLSGQASQAFTLSFGGSGFDLARIDDQEDFATNNLFTYDLCICDFDLDGKADAAVTNQDQPVVNFFINTSTINTLTFTNTPVNNGISTATTDCGDLDGDGKPDVVFGAVKGTDLNHIFIYRNTSTPGNFSSVLARQFKLPTIGTDNRVPQRVMIAEIDGDGKPELVVGNTEDNTLLIYINNSSPGSISFNSTPVLVTVTGSTDAGEFDVADLDNNGLSDIVVISFEDANEEVFVLKNQSSPGNISLINQPVINVTGNRQFVRLADLDLDDFPEIITSDRVSDEISIFANTTQQSGEITFDTPIEFDIPDPWGIAAGDFNGDSKVDLIISSLASGIYFVENSSSAGALSFSVPVAKSNALTSRNIKAADFNGDAKPDLGFTYNSVTNQNGFFSVMANRNCLVPVISPADLTFCVGNAFTLNTIKTAEATYDWSTTGDATLTENNDEVTVTVNSGTTITIDVKITSDDGICENTASQTFDLTGGSPPTAPVINIDNAGTICSGEAFTLSGPAGQDIYMWTMPDGSTANGPELTIDPATSSNAGIYALRIQEGTGCFSETGTRTVTIEEPPSVSINNLGEVNFCETGSTTLEVPDYDGFTYQWRLDGTVIDGEISNTLTATASGDYTVAVVDAVTECENISEAIGLTAVTLPQGSFTSDSEICVGVDMAFTATSTPGNPDFGLNYTWDFGDGSATATGAEVSHIFVGPTTPGSADTTYTVTLTTAYDGVNVCSIDVTETITVTDQQVVDIIVPDGSTEKCPTDSIRLELPQGYQSYAWSTGDDTYFTYAKTAPGEDEVTVTVDMVTDIGCSVPSEITISNYADSGLEITSTEATIVDDAMELESGVSSVTLTATNGSGFSWEPLDILKILNLDSSSVVVFPRDPETVVSVRGIDAANCEITDSLTITTPGVIPRKAFSPNGDNLGYDCWEILNSNTLEGCKVHVMDQRGRHVFTGDSPFADDCVWNGNIDNGSKQAPEGLYYFVMKCDNASYSRTGTILLAR